MKAITLTQPWAHLVMLGAKQWETRSWPTPFRGQIAIHASKNYPNSAKAMEREPFYRDALYGSGDFTYPARSCGRIIAIANITDCRKTSDFWAPGSPKAPSDAVFISDAEAAFGNYDEGRYAFKLENVLRIPQIECKGALGLWTVPDLIAIQILDDLRFLQRKEKVAISADG